MCSIRFGAYFQVCELCSTGYTSIQIDYSFAAIATAMNQHSFAS